ncbi:MAG: toll/interleukin-1 receptor domain-containing protein [Thiolinea sp.]
MIKSSAQPKNLAMTQPKKVFISYSHDSDKHREFVRNLADRLRRDGLDCQIDQYVNGFPAEGWQRWMENHLEAAEYVLLVCTENYLRRYRGQETDAGKGVNFEGLVISQHLYDAYYRNTKFIPVIPEGGSFEHVPTPLRGFNTYTLTRDYDALYRYLTQQPEHSAPPLGPVRKMPAADPTLPSPTANLQPATPAIPTNAINADRRTRLEEKLRRLYEQYDLETRVEEKLRLEPLIREVEKELAKLQKT